MNIFYLHKNTVKCAEMHCDKHVVKMCIEYAQILSTTHRVIDGEPWVGTTVNGRKIQRYFHPDTYMNERLYKASHINHPSTVWARQSRDNYNWLYDLWMALCLEYTHRYGKKHECQRKLEDVLLIPPMKLTGVGFTEPPPAMKAYPECVVEGDSVTSYRNFYWEDKREFAKWSNRDKPYWWIEKETGVMPRELLWEDNDNEK